MVEKLKYEWLNQPGKNILAGIVVALALIPEAIAFSIIAGVDPMVGLYASFIIAVVTAVVGGTILMGIIQLILGLLKVGRLMKFIPHSVMIGFVNALGIMIFMSQI